MMMNPGIHKENYRGFNIYWRGTYNVEGDATEYSGIMDARLAIDNHIIFQAEKDRLAHENKLAEAKKFGLWASRNGDSVTLHTPDGIINCTIREYRNRILWEIEEKYNRDIIFE